MKKSNKKKGFTLLELLLVVGIASILIVAGITTYNLVNKGNQINETVRLVNTLMDQTRRMFASTGNYGGAIEAALINTTSVPARYVAGLEITTPFSRAAAAVTIAAADGGANFALGLIVPPAYAPEIAQAFNPGQDTNIVKLNVCNRDITAANAVAEMPVAINATRDACKGMLLPAAANITITSR